MKPDRRLTAESWTTRAEIWLIAAAIIFLAAYAAPIIWPGLPPGLRRWCTFATITVWVVFLVDYIARLILSHKRFEFVRQNWFDLLVLTLPILRPLRLLRLLAILSVLNRTGSRSVRGRVIVYSVGGALLLLVVGALAITDSERGRPGANINNIGDGLWWAITTMTTVGYGDRYPTSIIGRCVAASLMIGGIALLGVVTGLIASWLVERVEEVTDDQSRDVRDSVEKLTAEVAELRGAIAALADDLRPATTRGPEQTPY